MDIYFQYCLETNIERQLNFRTPYTLDQNWLIREIYPTCMNNLHIKHTIPIPTNLCRGTKAILSRICETCHLNLELNILLAARFVIMLYFIIQILMELTW